MRKMGGSKEDWLWEEMIYEAEKWWNNDLTSKEDQDWKNKLLQEQWDAIDSLSQMN